MHVSHPPLYGVVCFRIMLSLRFIWFYRRLSIILNRQSFSNCWRFQSSESVGETYFIAFIMIYITRVTDSLPFANSTQTTSLECKQTSPSICLHSLLQVKSDCLPYFDWFKNRRVLDSLSIYIYIEGRSTTHVCAMARYKDNLTVSAIVRLVRIMTHTEDT